MFRIALQSRNGNRALAIIGGLYAISATAVLLWFVIDVGNAALPLDRALQLMLVVAAAVGVWFLTNGLRNLGVRIPRPRFARAS